MREGVAVSAPRRWVVIRSWTVEPSTYAQGTRCQGSRHTGPDAIEPGRVVTLIVDATMGSRQPTNPDSRRYLCDGCLVKLGDRVSACIFHPDVGDIEIDIVTEEPAW
jgi:hypothetical protein